MARSTLSRLLGAWRERNLKRERRVWRGERDGGGESFVHPVAVETTLKPNPRRKSHEIKVLELLNQAVGMGEECRDLK